MVLIGKRPHPMIRKLSELLVSGNRDVGNRPKNYELGKVGLSIIVDEQKSKGHEILAKHAFYGSTNLSDPIPVSKFREMDGYTYARCLITNRIGGDENRSQTSDFLSSCQLCKKKLHGKDVYMYRGEEGFCSVECRSRHIMIDTHKQKQKYRSKVAKSPDVSSSYSTCSPVLSTGIFAI